MCCAEKNRNILEKYFSGAELPASKGASLLADAELFASKGASYPLVKVRVSYMGGRQTVLQ